LSLGKVDGANSLRLDVKLEFALVYAKLAAFAEPIPRKFTALDETPDRLRRHLQRLGYLL
jgi:hypothetical protein